MKPTKKSKKIPLKNDKLVKRVYQVEKNVTPGVQKYKLLEEQKAIRKLVVSNETSTSPKPISIEIIENTIGRKLVMSDLDVAKFTQQTKLAMKYLMINGKKYKEGSVIDVPLNPYIFEPNARKPKKGLMNELKNVTKTGNLIERDVIAPDDEGELPDPDEALGGGDNREEGDENEGEDYGEEEQEDDEVVEIDDTIEKESESPVKGGKTVQEYDFEFKEVDIFTGEEKEIALRLFGLGGKKTKLMPVLREDKARPGAKVMFGKSEKYEVVKGPYGILTLKHYAPFGYDGATEIEKQELSPDDLIIRAPLAPKIPEPPESYTGKFKFGDYITFNSFSDTILIEGVVTSTGKTSFNLISIGDSPKRYIDINYSKVSSVKVLPFPEKIKSGKNQITIANTIIDIDTNDCKSKLCKNIKPNTFIRFKYTKSFQKGYGYITGFTETHYIILSKHGRALVPYSETLEMKEYPKKEHLLKFKLADTEATLFEPVIPGTRERVITILFELLSKLFEKPALHSNTSGVTTKIEWVDEYPRLIYISDLERDSSLHLLSQKIDWPLHNQGILKWDVFYNVKFNEWLYNHKFRDIIRDSVPDYTKFAKESREFQLSPTYAAGYVKEITDAYGDDVFKGTGIHFLNRIEEISQKPGFAHTQLTSFLRTEFNRIGRDKLQTYEGKMLAMVITRCLLKYRELYTPEENEIKMMAENQWKHEKFQTFRGTAEQQAEFDQTMLIAISDEFKILTEAYQHNEKLVTEYNNAKEKLREKYSSSKELEEGSLLLNGKVLSKEGVKLHEDIVKLEEQIYNLHKETNLDYLMKVYEILLFLDKTSRPGKYAEYFRAKILSENYQVKNLASATIYHAFPEFFINQKLTDREFALGVKLLKKDLYNAVIDFVNIWILQHISSIPIVPNFVNPGLNKKGWKDLNDWKNYIISVPVNCANSGSFRIKKGANLTGDTSNLEDYECRKVGEVKKCTAKREPISPEDTILCYSDGKFVCLSINDVMHALADKKRGEKNVVNPITGVEYSQDFLDRMELRYGDEVDLEKYPHRVLEIEFKDTSVPKNKSVGLIKPNRVKSDISKKSKSKKLKK